MTSIPAAINTLQLFGDNATAQGLFKSVGDAIIFKEALETLVIAINERNEKIGNLQGMIDYLTKEKDPSPDNSERTMP